MWESSFMYLPWIPGVTARCLRNFCFGVSYFTDGGFGNSQTRLVNTSTSCIYGCARTEVEYHLIMKSQALINIFNVLYYYIDFIMWLSVISLGLPTTRGYWGLAQGFNFVPCDVQGTAPGTAWDCRASPNNPGHLGQRYTMPGDSILYFATCKVRPGVGPRSAGRQFSVNHWASYSLAIALVVGGYGYNW